MTSPLDLKKGPLGYMLEMRAGMTRAGAAIDSWLKAFDVGDMAALCTAGELLKEALNDVGEASKAGEESEK